MMNALLSLLVVAQVAPGLPQPLPFPQGKSSTINIVEWDSNQLPKPIQRSEQPPLTDDELMKLAAAGFEAPEVVKMVEQRRCACDASADGLIKLKKAGVAKEVLAAVSLHALKPNRALEILVSLDFTGQGNTARQGTLYFFVDDGDLTRVFSADLNSLLSGRWAHESMVDQSDLLIAKSVRRIQLVGQIPLKTYGKHTVMVAASANPTLKHPSQLSAAERAKAQMYTFDYPRASVFSQCRLSAGYKRDPLLEYQWNFVGSRFECEWN